MRGPQGWEWIVILLVVLLLFGARRLPDLARSVGRSVRIFRSEIKEGRTEADHPVQPPSSASPTNPTEPPSGANDDGGPHA